MHIQSVLVILCKYITTVIASLRALPTPGPTVSKPAPLQISYGHCLMIRYGQCAIALEGDEADETCTEGIEWITCDNCGGWYHMEYAKLSYLPTHSTACVVLLYQLLQIRKSNSI